MYKMLNNQIRWEQKWFPVAGKNLQSEIIFKSIYNLKKGGVNLKPSIPQQDLFYLYALALLQNPRIIGHGGCMCVITYGLTHVLIGHKDLRMNKRWKKNSTFLRTFN